jgi:hypothetical protein
MYVRLTKVIDLENVAQSVRAGFAATARLAGFVKQCARAYAAKVRPFDTGGSSPCSYPTFPVIPQATEIEDQHVEEIAIAF